MIDNNLYKKHRAHKAWTVIVLTFVFFNVKYIFMKKNLYTYHINNLVKDS